MAVPWSVGAWRAKIAPNARSAAGFVIMLVIAVINLAVNLAVAAHASWALLPLGIFSFGWALMVPVVTFVGAGPASRTAWHGIQSANVHRFHSQAVASVDLRRW